MNKFCVLHITKYKGDLGRIGGHIDRLHIPHNANEEKIGFNEEMFLDEDQNFTIRLKDILGIKIDKKKSKDSLESYALNKDYHKLSLEEAVEKRIQEGHTVIKNGKIETIRHDAVKAVGVVLTGSPELMYEIEKDQKLFDEWKKANFNFMASKFNKDNIVRFVLHIDELTPHIHCIFVPISPEGRLSASYYLDWALTELQDSYALAMKPFGFVRGVSKIFTQKQHQDTQEYYKKKNRENIEITAKVAANPVVQDIKLSTPWKLDKVREQVIETIVKTEQAAASLQDEHKKLAKTNNNMLDKKRDLVYHQLHETYTKNISEWIKAEIPLDSFLISQLGWRVNREKNSRRWPSLVHPTKDIKIIFSSTPLPNGHRIFKCVQGSINGRESGSLIDILEDAGWSSQQIRSLADGAILPQLHSVAQYHKQSKKLLHIEKDPATLAKEVKEHLSSLIKKYGHSNNSGILEERKIIKETYRNLQGFEINKRSIAFLLYQNIDEEGNANLCSSITYWKNKEGAHSKLLQDDKPRGFSILTDEKGLIGADKIVITESPIDALSYRQLSIQAVQGWEIKKGAIKPKEKVLNERVAFISTCGNISRSMEKDFRTLFKMASEHGKTIIVAMDYDMAGKEMAENIMHLAQDAGCDYHQSIPTIEKDWNDVLLNIKRLEAIYIYKEMASNQWDHFEEGLYEESFLHQLGIRQSTYQAFNTLKTNEQGVIVSMQDPQEGSGERIATWTLKGQRSTYTEYPPENSPCVSVLKGDPEHATQIVLVTSPIDALIHYQNETSAQDRTCYIYVDARYRKKIERPLFECLKVSSVDKITLATSKEPTQPIISLEEILQKHKTDYISSIVTIQDPVIQISTPVHKQHALDFAEGSYQESLLYQLGINLSTYQAFSEFKTNAERVLVTLQEHHDVPGTNNGIWQLENTPNGLREHTDFPSSISILKGDISTSKKIVLTSSPIDALIHYQTQGDNNKDTCYVYIDAKSKEISKEPVKNLKGYLEERKTEISIAQYGQDNTYPTKRIQSLFKEEDLKAYAERIRQEIPLVPFLSKELGWKIQQTDSSLPYSLLTNTDGKSLKVPNEPDKTYGWVYTDEKEKRGNLIDLLLFQEKWDWKPIIDLAQKKFLPPIEVIAIDKIDVSYSILNTYGINKSVYESLDGMSANYKQATFELFNDFTPNGVYSPCSNITYFKDDHGNESKYFKKGAHRGLSILKDRDSTLEDLETIVITDSPMNSLQYRKSQIDGQEVENTLFISTCGHITPEMKKDVEKIIQFAKNHQKKIKLEFEKSTFEKRIERDIIQMLKKEEVAYTIDKSKQFNPQERWEMFKEVKYEESLLSDLGIEKPTYLDFKHTIRDNQHSISIALTKPHISNDIPAIWNVYTDKENNLQERLQGYTNWSILKGDITKSDKIVLVTSPIEALLHYQEHKKLDTISSNHCYVYVDARNPKILQSAIQEIRANSGKEIFITEGSKNQDWITNLKNVLTNERISYKVQSIIRSGTSFIGSLMSVKRKFEPDEDKNEHENKINRIIKF